MKKKVMEFIDTIQFNSRSDAYAFLDAVQKDLERSGEKVINLMRLCMYSVVGKLPDDISVEDSKKYIWTYEDFNDALVYTGAADSFSTYRILLPECKEVVE